MPAFNPNAGGASGSSDSSGSKAAAKSAASTPDGKDPSGAPAVVPVPAPPPVAIVPAPYTGGTPRSGAVALGPWKWPLPGTKGCIAIVTWNSSAKIDKKEASGKSDARMTYQGRKVGELEIEIQWIESDANDNAATDFLFAVGPRGANPGVVWDLSAVDQKIHNAEKAIVEELKGPERKPGTNLTTAKLKASTWTAPAKIALGKGVAKTPDDSQKWIDNPTKKIGSNGNTVGGFGPDPATGDIGSNGNSVGGFNTPNAPAVNP